MVTQDKWERAGEFCNKIGYGVSGAFFLIGWLSVVAQVLFRNVPLLTIVWGEELAKYAYIYVSLFASIILVREESHLSVDLFLKMFPVKLHYAVKIFINVISIVFMAVMVWLSWGTMVYNIPNKTAALRVSYAWIYLAFVVGFALMIFQEILVIRSSYRKLRAGGREVL